MKKTGKVLSLVLSLALVASSLVATTASAAAAGDPTVGVSVSFNASSDYNDGTQTLALVAGGTGDALTLPTPVLKYTTASGKVYATKVLTAGTDYTWSSSDSSVADIDSDTKVKPGTKKTAGTATLTCSINSKAISYSTTTSSTDKVTVSGSNTIAVKTYAVGSYVIIDDGAAGSGLKYVPSTTTELAVNDSPKYVLAKVTANSENKVLPDFTASEVATWKSSNNDYIGVTYNSGVATVAAQYTDKVHITGVTLTATDNGNTATLAIHTAQIYNTAATGTGAGTTISASNAYGTGNAQAAGLKSTMTNGTQDAGMYNVSNYAIKGSSVQLDGGTVASINATAAATVNGGTVSGTLHSDGTVTLNAGSVGSVDAGGNVTANVASGKTLSTGAIAADGTVTVSGKGAAVGAIRAKDEIAVRNGATTGAITIVPTTSAQDDESSDNVAFALSYKDVQIDSATVNGNIVCGKGSVIKGTARDNNVVIPTVVKGNVLAYNDGYPDGTVGAGTVQIGSADPSEKVTINGSVADQTGMMGITLNGVSDGTTAVGAVTGKAPATGKAATSTLTFDGFTGSFSALPNFDTVTLQNKSAVTLTSALSVNGLALSDANSTLTAPSASLNAAGTSATYALSGSGKLVVPAGALVVKGNVSGTPVVAPSTNVAVGTMVFKGISGLANTVSVPGVTLEEKSNGDNTYNYVAKAVTFGGIQLDQSSVKVAKGYTATLKASSIPTGAALPTGESVKWEAPDGAYVTVTPSADGMSATLKATDWSDVDLGGANEVTVSAYVVKADGTQDYNYATQTCAVTVIEKPEVVPASFKIDSVPSTMKIGQQYTVKITGTDATAPQVAFAGDFAIINSKTVSGYDTFVKFTAAKSGEHGMYVSGTKVAVIKVDTASICDTKTVTKKAGQSYTFKVTSSAVSFVPQFGVASISGNIKPTKQVGKDFYYTVKATSAKGAHGVYINGVKVATYTFA